MADEYTLQPAMDACIRENADTNQQATGRAAFGAAGQADLDLAEADIATNAADIAINAADIATNTADIATNAAAAALATVWMGEWPSGGTTALARQQYRDGEWLSIANKTTTERPAPQPSGPVSSELPDTPAWTTATHTGSIRSDTSYVFTQGGWIKSAAIWVPDIDPAITYQLAVFDITDPANVKAELLALPPLTANAWTVVALSDTVVPTGTNLLFRLTALNSSSSTQNSSQWTAGGADNGAAPITGQWNYRSQQDELRINYTDGNAVDQTALINSVIPGSTIKCSQASEPNNYWIYTVTGSIDMGGTAREFQVSLTETGPGGGPVGGEVCDILFDVPVPASTSVVTIANHWATNDPSWATIDSQLYYSDVQQGLDGAFGHRIEFQPAYVSPDWDVQATYSIGSRAPSSLSATSFGSSFKESGWATYADSTYTTGSRLNINNAIVQLTNDGLGATSETSYLPTPVGSPVHLWQSNAIIPIAIGDTYDLRVDFEAEATGVDVYGDLLLDIGSPSGTIIIRRNISFNKTGVMNVSVAFPIYSLVTFFTNGGRFYMDMTGSGDEVDIFNFRLFIKRNA